MEMSTPITHAIQFFLPFTIDHLNAERVYSSTFVWKIDHKYFLKQETAGFAFWGMFFAFVEWAGNCF